MLETAYEILADMKGKAESQLKKIKERMVNEDPTVGHITSHCLRHAFAARAVENGMKPQVLKAIMGHSSLAMTMDLYSHVLGEEKVQEMVVMENLF